MTSDPIARYLATRGARLGRRQRLRAMTVSEILDMGLRVYRNLGWTFLRLSLVPSLFCLGGVAFVIECVLPSLGTTHNAASVSAQIGEAAVSMGLALFVGGPLFVIGTSYTCALVVSLTADFMLGRPIDEAGARKSAIAATRSLLVTALWELFLSSAGIIMAAGVMGIGGLLSQKIGEDSPWSGAIVLVGMLGLGLGGLWFLYVVAVHSLAPAVMVLERRAGLQAGKRSAYLLRQQLGNPSGTSGVFNVYALIGVAWIIEELALGAIIQGFDVPAHARDLFSFLPFSALVSSAVALLPHFVAIWTLVPVWASCVTILYYERRIRLEGFDIEALADEISRNDRPNRFDV